MIGMLIRNETDLVAAALTHNSNRATSVDFITAINREVMTLIAPANHNQIVLWWVYLSLFQPSSWVFCAAMIAATSVGFFTIDKSGINRFHPAKEFESFSILNGLAVAALLFMQLSYTVVSNSFSSRILLLATAIATYILYSFFISDLVSRMATGMQPIYIKSFQDVIDGNYDVKVVASSASHELLKEAIPSSAMQTFYYAMMHENLGLQINTQFSHNKIKN
jgi:hypothetical protein